MELTMIPTRVSQGFDISVQSHGDQKEYDCQANCLRYDIPQDL